MPGKVRRFGRDKTERRKRWRSSREDVGFRCVEDSSNSLFSVIEVTECDNELIHFLLALNPYVSSIDFRDTLSEVQHSFAFICLQCMLMNS